MALAGNLQTLVRTGAGTNTLTQQQKTFYEAMLIKHLLPFLDFVNDGQKGTIPRNSGGFTTGSIKFRKRNPITLTSAHTTALTEGVPPDFSDVTWAEVTTQLAQYGAALKHSDIIAHAGIDDNIAQFAAALGELAGLVINTLIVNELAGGGTVQYAGGSADRNAIDAGENLDADEIRLAVRTLQLANVPTFPDGYYHGYIHIRQAYDLADDPDWQMLNGNGYRGQGGMESGITAEMGRLFGVKFMKPSNTTPTFTNTDPITIYAAFIMGPDAFAVRDFAAWRTPRIDPATGKGIRIYFVPADTETKDDPLGQFGTMGYKFAFVAKVLDSTRYVRLETAAS
jgi:N4-gp56 family major capsid protein